MAKDSANSRDTANDMQGQRVAVFGALRGIGRAIAESFKAAGAEVIGFDLESPSDATSIFTRFVRGDVTQFDQVQEFGRLADRVDHVVYSVGIGSGKVGFPFWRLEPGDWHRVIEVNLMGAVNVAHAFAPAMAERNRGTFLFLVSVAGQIGSQTDPPYSAAKAALINFVQCAARDLAPFGVRVNAMAPGMVQTELNRSVWEASQNALPFSQRVSYEVWANEKLARVAPLARWQKPSEFGAMAVFLASDHARSITGQTINIDGGQVMHS